MRKKGHGTGGEVTIPADAALPSNRRITSRILEMLMKDVSTRNDPAIRPDMAETVDAGKSPIRRQSMAAGE